MTRGLSGGRLASVGGALGSGFTSTIFVTVTLRRQSGQPCAQPWEVQKTPVPAHVAHFGPGIFG